MKSDQTAYTNYYKAMKAEDAEQWPPKFWKLRIETADDPAVEVAYTDPRRFGRIRLVNCPGDDIRKYSPLVENGPDPVVDKDVFTEDYLKQKMKARHVPIKALLLDQAMISGIGNWVGDEVLYHAKLHPEQYSNEFSDDQMHQLYKSICYVCQLACDKLADSDQFPDDWMFNYRWGKGKKHSHLPNGQRLAFLKVGGRTSCYAPDVQKNTGHVAEGVKEEPIVSEDDEQPKKKKTAAKSRAKTKKEESDESDVGPRTKKKPAAKSKTKVKEEEEGKEEEDTDEKPKNKKPASKAKPAKAEVAEIEDKPSTLTKKRKAEKEPADTSRKSKKQEVKPPAATNGSGTRRSSRLGGRAA